MSKRRFISCLCVLIPLVGLFDVTVVSAQDEPPSRCLGHGQLLSQATMDWESGLGAWTAGNRNVADPGSFNTPDWSVVGDLPDSRSGMAAFVPDRDTGDCDSDDQSGVMYLESPTVTFPQSVQVPRISLTHWMVSEYLFDGGNLKLSVNGGAFEVLPPSAFEFGGYTATLASESQANTNPLESQPTFTGTNGAPMLGAWGDSRINLSGIVLPGDSVRLRIEFGVDACGGEIGWYVDDVTFYSCALEPLPSQCGNGRLDAGEVCDDGNDRFGDGCSSSCQIEENWTCTDPLGDGTVGDPGFEGGTPNAQWSEYSLTRSTPLCTAGRCPGSGGSGPLSGNWWAWFGSSGDREEASVEQTLTIPSSVATLDFGLEVAACGTSFDYLRVLIDETEIWREQGQSPLCSEPGYHEQSVDVSAFADGGSHELQFQSEVLGPRLSSFSVDGVELAGRPGVCERMGDGGEPGINAGHSGAWYNDQTSGQGIFIDIDESSRYMFISWFSYTFEDSGNPYEQHWYTAQGNYSGNRAELELNESLGGLFDEPQLPETTPVGQVTLEFDDCENGVMTYRFDDGGPQGEFPLIRVVPGSGNICAQRAANTLQAVDINPGMDGAWYEEATTGQGFFIDAHSSEGQDDYLFVAWFTYGNATASGQRWLTAQGSFEGLTATIEISETTDGSFDDPRPVNNGPVGSMTLDFADCGNASLSYTLDGEPALSGEIPLTRLLSGATSLCEELTQ